MAGGEDDVTIKLAADVDAALRSVGDVVAGFTDMGDAITQLDAIAASFGITTQQMLGEVSEKLAGSNLAATDYGEAFGNALINIEEQLLANTAAREANAAAGVTSAEQLAAAEKVYADQKAADEARVATMSAEAKAAIDKSTEALLAQGMSFKDVAASAGLTTGALKLVVDEQAKLEESSKGFFDTLMNGSKQSEADAVTWGVIWADALKNLSAGITGAIASFPSMIASMADVGDNAKTMAEQLGMPIEQISELKYISEQSGTPLTLMTKSLTTLGTQLQDSGSKASAAVRSIGLIPAELNKLKGAEKIEAINDAIAKMGPEFDGAGKYVEIFGAKGQKMAALVHEDIGELNERFKQLGGAENKRALGELGDEFNDLSNDVQVSMSAFKEAIAVNVLPTINAVLKHVSDLPPALLIAGSMFADVAKSMGPMVGQMALMTLKEGGIAGLQKGILSMIPSIGGLTTAFTGLSASMLASVGIWVAIAAAVVALAAVVYKMIGGWEGLVAIFNATVEAVKPVATFLKDLFDIVVILSAFIIGDLIKAFNDLWKSTEEGTSWLNTLWNAAVSFYKAILDFPILGHIVKGITIYFESLGVVVSKVWEGLKGLMSWLGKATHDQAEIARAQMKAQQDEDAQRQKTNETKKESVALDTKGMDAADQALARTKQITEALAALSPALREQIKLQLQDGNAKEVAANMAARMGLSVDMATDVIARFQKELKESAKAAKDNPLAKLMESAKDLSVELDAATKSGLPLTDVIDQFGKKAAEIASKAALAGALDKISEKTLEVGRAFLQAQIAEKLEDIATKGDEVSRAFSEKMFAGVASAVATIKGMQDSITESTLYGSELRIHQIEKEYQATVTSVASQQTANDKLYEERVRKADEEAALAQKVIEDRQLAGEKITAFEIGQIDARHDAQVTEAKLALQTTTALGQATIKVARNVADNKLALARKMTDYALEQEKDEHDRSLNLVELDLQQRGLKTRAFREREYTAAKAALDKMLQAQKDGTAQFYNWEIDAQRKKVALMESEFEKEAAARGLVTKESNALVADQLEDHLKFMRDHEKDFTKDQIKEYEERVRAAKIAAGQISESFIKGLAKVADVTKQAGAALTQLGESMDSDLLKKFGEGLQFASEMMEGLGGVMSAMAKGDTIGAIMAGVSMAVKAVGKLWDAFTSSKGEKAMKDIGKNFRNAMGEALEVSEEFGDKIAANAKDMFGGSALQAELYNLSDIIEEAGGLSEKNFDNMQKHLAGVFDQIGKGSFTIEHATKVLDDNFTTFAEKTLETGKIASKGFQEIIALNAKFGTQSKEIAEFVSGQMARLGEGFQKMMAPLAKIAEKSHEDLKEEFEAVTELKEQRDKLLDKIGTDPKFYSRDDADELAKITAEWQKQTAVVDAARKSMDVLAEASMPEIHRAGRLMTASFNAATQSGMGMLEAIDQLGPGLDELLKTTENLGITTEAAGLTWIVDFRNRVNVNRELVDSAGSLNEVMLAMSNIGALNEESFADLQAQAGLTYDDLLDKGFTENESLKMMSSFLDQARTAHEQMGLPIDENTQKLIDQATAAGVLKEQEMSTNDIMMEGLSAIIKALGGDIPEAFKKVAAANEESAAQMKKLGKTIDDTVIESVDETSEKVEETPWDEYAEAGVAAAGSTGIAVGSLGESVKNVASSLGSTDWNAWADTAVAACTRVSEAVDGVSLGHSPGGIKEIPIKLNEAMRAFKQWEQQGVVSASAVEDAINGIESASLSAAKTVNAGQQSMSVQSIGDIHVSINTEAIDSTQRSREVAEEMMNEFTKILSRKVQYGVAT